MKTEAAESAPSRVPGSAPNNNGGHDRFDATAARTAGFGVAAEIVKQPPSADPTLRKRPRNPNPPPPLACQDDRRAEPSHDTPRGSTRSEPPSRHPALGRRGPLNGHRRRGCAADSRCTPARAGASRNAAAQPRRRNTRSSTLLRRARTSEPPAPLRRVCAASRHSTQPTAQKQAPDQAAPVLRRRG